MPAPVQVEQVDGWTDNAVTAMQANPPYFAWWDRWKTRGLVVTLGILAFVTYRSQR